MKAALAIATTGLTVLAVSLAVADNPAPVSSRLAASALLESPAKTPPTGEKPGEKLREGTRLTDEIGGFSRVGERVSFAPSKGDSLKCLENLALERIARAIDESQGQRQWIVSGVVTEFKGANYLLVTKAVIRLQEGETASGP